MAPTSKPNSISKAKFKSSKVKQDLLKSSKPAVSFSMKKNNIKEQLLKGRKPAVSSSGKENHKTVKRELLKGRKPAVSSNTKGDHHVQLKKLEAENDALRKTLAAKEHVTTMVPRPEKGVAGNGFNLREAMGLADDVETYTLLRRSVRDLAAQAGLDCGVLWFRQPKDVISKIIGAARERHSYFKRFPHGWAIEEFLKSNLKNKRAYARKRGYLGDRTNQGVESDEESKSDEDKDGGSDLDQGSDVEKRASGSNQCDDGAGSDNGRASGSKQRGDGAGSDNGRASGRDDNIEDDEEDEGRNRGCGGKALATDDDIESDSMY